MSASERLSAFILGPEREDAARRLADTAYWGDTGHWVLQAVIEVEACLRGTPPADGEPLVDWLRTLLAAVEARHERFRDNEDDPDGYGSATFHACRRRLAQLIAEAETAG